MKEPRSNERCRANDLNKKQIVSTTIGGGESNPLTIMQKPGGTLYTINPSIFKESARGNESNNISLRIYFHSGLGESNP